MFVVDFSNILGMFSCFLVVANQKMSLSDSRTVCQVLDCGTPFFETQPVFLFLLKGKNKLHYQIVCGMYMLSVFRW